MNDNVIALLHRAGQAADETFMAARAGSTATARQQVVLAAILEREEPSQTILVEATGIDRSTMADVVRRLTQRGFVTRRRTKRDARRYAVRLTEKGLAEAQRAAQAADAASTALLGKLPVKLRAPFREALQTIAGVNLKAAE